MGSENNNNARGVQTHEILSANKLSSTWFRAVLGAKAEELMSTDIGADVNIIESRTLKRSTASAVKGEEEKLSNLNPFGMDAISLDSPFGMDAIPLDGPFGMGATSLDGEQSKPTCGKEVFIDTELQIMLSSCLLFRNICWLVTRLQRAEPPLARAVLERFGLDTVTCYLPQWIYSLGTWMLRS